MHPLILALALAQSAPFNAPFPATGTAAGGMNVNTGTTMLGVVDPTNSTGTPLGAGAIFTGAGVDMLGYAQVSFSASADVISAVDGIEMQWSADDLNWSTRGVSSLTAARLGQMQATDLSQRTHDRTYWRMSGTALVGLTAARWGLRGLRRSLPGRSGSYF